jgi:type II secretory ATPase GspE/PulE/Tfp pilus assembly ATPase PilB-like protein
MKPSQEEHVTFWQTVAEALNAGGKTIVGALSEAKSALAGTDLEKAVASLIADVESGKTLSEAMGKLPEVFDKRIVKAVDAGERGGVMAPVASLVASALQAKDLTELETLLPSPEAIEYVSDLIAKALQARAGDLHFDQGERGRGHVRMRIDGVLHEVDPPPEGTFPKVIDYIKVMAGMNVAERRLPQDGQCAARTYNLRVSTVPAYYGERAVIRIINRETEDILLGLPTLGLSDEDLGRVQRLCHLPSGLVVVNGPTGSGKTTLLYSMLMELNQPDRAIITVEDPVEFTFDRIGQIQIRPQIGLTFARAVRHMLRQAPNVIMVGEIRDLEIAECVVQAALTGHLVLTTLHANNSVLAIKRILDIGIQPHLVNSALAGVISMRLVRTLCGECKQPADLPRHSVPPEAAQFVASRKDARFFKPKGCEHCRATGFSGRTAIFEVLTMNDRLRQLIADTADLAAMREGAKDGGMKTMLMDGLTKAGQGITSVEEVLRVAPVGANV